MKFKFSKHALEQMALREISKPIVEKVLTAPGEIKKEGYNTVYQSIVKEGKYLIRIFVNEETNPKLIITVYKTSKIKKYYEGKI